MSILKIKKIDFFINFFVVFAHIILYFLIAKIIFKKQQDHGTKRVTMCDKKRSQIEQNKYYKIL